MVRLLVFLLALGRSAAAADLFVDQIHPVLAQRCLSCHAGARPQAGLSLESRAQMMKAGGELVLKKIRGQAGLRMPPAGDALTPAQVAAFERWIGEGAVWPDMKTAPSAWVAPLAPRRVAIPEGTATNPIDRFLAVYARQHKVQFPAVVDNARFYRRAHYDVWGLPSTGGKEANREALVDSLLADNKSYTAHWISFWNDLLRNDIGVVYHGDRKSITPWLQQALEENLPYDEMVRQLLNPATPKGPDGFLTGVNWRGDVNASQLPHIQAAQNTAQIFLGINLKCASCHDSFINKYRLKQSYSLAAMFAAESRLELVRCDAPTGQFTEAEFLYPELGTVPTGAPLAERRSLAAKLFTHPGNGRLARTMVNRYWRKLMGRGLVEPVDELDAEPWNADLLDWLAVDFADHNYDLKHLLRRIMTSQAYQLPAVSSTESRPGQPYVFRGPEARRLTAEQFLDTVSAITGEWRTLPVGETARYVRDWELKSTALSRALGRPIRDQVYTTRADQATTFQALELVNGETLTTLLRRGARRMLGELPSPAANKFDSKPLRQGAVKFDIDITGVKQLWLLMEDAGSYDPGRVVAGWAGAVVEGPAGGKKLSELTTLTKFVSGSMTANKEALADAQLVPVGTTMIYNIEGLGLTRLRGQAGVDDGARASDVGPTVRFFVFAEEPDRHQLIRVTGERPVKESPPLRKGMPAWDDLSLALWGRRPTAAERAKLDAPARDRATDLEDKLWMLLMHPECQYIL